MYAPGHQVKFLVCVKLPGNTPVSHSDRKQQHVVGIVSSWRSRCIPYTVMSAFSLLHIHNHNNSG